MRVRDFSSREALRGEAGRGSREAAEKLLQFLEQEAWEELRTGVEPRRRQKRVAYERLALVDRLREAIATGADPFPVTLAALAGIPLSALRSAAASEEGAAKAWILAEFGFPQRGGAPPKLSPADLEFARDAARKRFRMMKSRYSRADAAKAIVPMLDEQRNVKITAETLARYLPTREELRAERDRT